MNVFIRFGISLACWSFFLLAGGANVIGTRRPTRADLLEGDIRTKPRGAWKNTQRWSDGIVPYEIDSSLSANHVRVIKEAMASYENLTCIRFAPRQNKHRDYVYFMNGGDGQCYSNLGRVGGRQNVSLGKWCDYFPAAVHEIGHALGFDHEHQRPDRDQYITILWEKIPEQMKFAYEKARPENVDLQGIKYDYLSIMHYDGGHIRTRDPSYQDKIGTSRGLSQCDLESINRWYNCVGYIQPGNPCSEKNSATTITTSRKTGSPSTLSTKITKKAPKTVRTRITKKAMPVTVGPNWVGLASQGPRSGEY